MSELLRKRQEDVRRRPLLSSVVLLVALVAAFAITGAATGNTTGTNACAQDQNHAQLGGSAFEIDLNANLVVDTANCIDWLTGGSGTSFRSGVNAKNDKASGTGDDSFGQGTAENDVTPTIVSGSIPPNKSDLKAFGLFSEVGQATTANPTGKFLELFWSRVQNPSGTTNMDFELNKKFCDPSANPTNCSSNGVTPVRSDGDRLVTYDLSKGGTVPTISIRTWSSSSSAWGAPTVISGGGTPDALGAVNTASLLAADTGGSTGGLTASLGSQDAYTFGEAALTFKALFSGSSTCGTFGSAYLKSRSSDSFTAEIKDFVAPERINVSNCTTLATSATASVTIGSTISDTATLSGATSNATGTITFKLYGPFTGSDPTLDSCTDGAGGNLVTSLGPIGIGSPNASGNYVVSSGTYQPTSVGRYQWKASYSGDANNSSQTSACKDTGEASVVTLAKPGIVTSATASVTIGGNISDTATLSNGTSDVSGTITFKLYGPFTGNDPAQDACTDGAGGNLVTTLTNTTVNGNGNYGSGNYQPTAVGRYQWVASYGGDAKNDTATSACKDTGEASVVSPAQPTIVTSATASATIGGSITDAATLSNGVSPTGTITFRAYGPFTGADPALDTCDANHLVFTSPTPQVAVNGNSTYSSSGSYTPTQVGRYQWIASYSGDAKNNTVSSSCNDANEQSVVSSAATTLATAQSAFPNDTATVTSAVKGFTGNVTFKAYVAGGGNTALANCTANGATGLLHSESVGLGSGDGTSSGAVYSKSAATSNTTHAVPPGTTVYWRVSYAGDGTHDGRHSTCAENTVLTFNDDAGPGQSGP